MKKRGVISVILFMLVVFLLAFFVHADQTTIFDGTLYHGETVKVGEVEYTATFKPGMATFLSQTGFGLIVYNDTCEEKDNVLFCINDIVWDYKNASTDREYYYGEVEIYQNTAEVDIDRVFDDTEITLGESMEIIVTLENTGEAPAKNIVYKDTYEDFQILYASEPCYIKGYSVYFEIFQLLVEDKKSCKYKVKALATKEFESKATVTYHNNIEVVEEESNGKDITINPTLLELNLTTDKDIVEVGENLTMFINLTNDEDDDFSGSMNINIPSAFKLLKKGYGLYYQAGMPSWKGTIDEDETKGFAIVLEARKAGVHDINLETSFFYKLKLMKSQVSKTIKVNDVNLTINSNLKDRYESGETVNIKLFANNPLSLISFRNIDIDSKSSLEDFVFTKSKSELAPGTSFELLNTAIKIPEVTKKTNFPLIINLDYNTEFFQPISRKETLDFIVVPEGYVESEETGDNKTAAEKSAFEEALAIAEEILGSKADKDQDTKADETAIDDQSTVEETNGKRVFADLFKNPLLIAIDAIVVLLIVYVLYSIFIHKRKINPNDIFIEKDEKTIPSSNTKNKERDNKPSS